MLHYAEGLGKSLDCSLTLTVLGSSEYRQSSDSDNKIDSNECFIFCTSKVGQIAMSFKMDVT